MNDQQTLEAKFEALGYQANRLLSKGELMPLYNHELVEKAELPSKYHE